MIFFRFFLLPLPLSLCVSCFSHVGQTCLRLRRVRVCIHTLARTPAPTRARVHARTQARTHILTSFSSSETAFITASVLSSARDARMTDSMTSVMRRKSVLFVRDGDDQPDALRAVNEPPDPSTLFASVTTFAIFGDVRLLRDGLASSSSLLPPPLPIIPRVLMRHLLSGPPCSDDLAAPEPGTSSTPRSSNKSFISERSAMVASICRHRKDGRSCQWNCPPADGCAPSAPINSDGGGVECCARLQARLLSSRERAGSGCGHEARQASF
jgi:hypothetical protein